MFEEVRCISCNRFEGYASGDVIFRCQCNQLNIFSISGHGSSISKEQVLAQFQKFNPKNKTKVKVDS